MPYLQRKFLRLSHVDITKDTYYASTGEQLWSSCENFFSCDSAITICVIRTLRKAVLESTAKSSHTQANVIWKVIFNLRMILLILLRVCLFSVLM